MQSVTNRRTFVRNVVVGVPMMAGLASMSHALGAHPLHDGARLEPALDSMLRDLARLHNQMRRRPVTPDDVRACAAHMRSLAAYQVRARDARRAVLVFCATCAERGRTPLRAAVVVRVLGTLP